MSSARQEISLNGEWDLAFDPENKGKNKKWFKNFPKQTKIQVPGVWEQVKPGYDGVGWYRKVINIEKQPGRVIRLEIGAAHYYADVYVNGRAAGSHEGGYTPFVFDITRLIKAGKNEITVRVINPPINHEIEGMRAGAPLNQGDLPIGKAAWYFNFGGLWQDVKLIITEPVYILDCFVEPFIWKKQAKINLTVMNSGKAGNYELILRLAPKKNPGIVTAEKTIKVKLKAGENKITAVLTFEKVNLWSDTDPFLYTVITEIIRDYALLDNYAVNFGMREFTIKKGGFYLNGKKVILKGFLQQGVYPRSLSFPHSREFAAKELQICKDFGFNFLRMHLKPAPREYLDLADEIGILLSAEPPSGWIGNSVHTERRLKNETREMFLRDRNHPSIIFWCILNEAYHFRGFTVPEITRLKDVLANDGRQYDPTRLLIDTSGGLPGAKKALTQIMLPYSHKRIGMMDLHAYCQLPLQDESLVKYRTMGEKGVVLFSSEHGAPEIPPDYQKVMSKYTPAERKLGLEDYKLHKDFYDSLKSIFVKDNLQATFGSVEDLIARANSARAEEIKHITAAMRSNPKFDGITLCQLADAAGELFGAVDIWRDPKPTWFKMAKASRTPYLSPEVLPRVIGETGTLNLRITLINEALLGVKYTYTVAVVSKTGKTVKKFSGKVTAKRGVQLLLNRQLKVKLKEGQYFLTATLFKNEHELSKDNMRFTVIKEAALKCSAVSVHDPEKVMGNKLKDSGILVKEFSNNSRDKNMPLLFDLRKATNEGWMLGELFGQLKKCVQLGGCAVLFESDPVLLHEHLFPTMIRQEGGGMSRGMDYIKQHPIFAGLPNKTLMEYEYANIYPTKYTKGGDIVKAGGKVISGNMDSHMWNRPACYFWKVSSAVVPVGRGHIILCNLKVMKQLGKDIVADKLFINLINYAQTLIKKGGEEKLLSRCIDPLEPKDYK